MRDIVNSLEVLTIGIVEGSKDRTTFNMLKNMFQSIDYEIHYINQIGNMVIFKKGHREILTIDINPDMIQSIKNLNVNFNILIHNFMDINKEDKSKLKEILGLSKSIILNCDEDNWNYLIENNNKSVVISYGFNNKAVINLSSYNIDDYIKASICFQRGIKNITGETIEPFELPIIINSKNKDHIYSAMAVLTCGVLVGHDIFLKNNIIKL